jgi:hypothetical protein
MQRALVAGQGSIRMKFVKAFSRVTILKLTILKFTVDLPFSG